MLLFMLLKQKRPHAETVGSDAPTYRKLELLVHCNLLFTLRASSDDPMHRKLKWLVYRISLFTLHALSDDPVYNSTTDQCGARSGLPQ